MKITDVRIRKISKEGKMRAIVSVTFNEEFVVHDIKIIHGQNGLFVAMPSRQIASGDFRDIAHPINSETREKIQDAIFLEYERVLESENEKFVDLSDSADSKEDEKSEEIDPEEEKPEEIKV